MLLNELICGPHSSAVSAQDHAIMLNTALDDVLSIVDKQPTRTVIERDLREQLQDSRTEAAALAKALHDVLAANKKLQDAIDDYRLVGTLIVPGAQLTSASEALSKTITEAAQIVHRYDDGELVY